MTKLDTFIRSYTPWEDIIPNKHILFDTNAVINIMFYESENILKVFDDKKAICCFIDPIGIELFNTDNPKIRIQRQEFLARNSFHKLPLDYVGLKKSSDIQAWLATQKIFPSVSDLYLGGVLGRFNQNSILLLTANIRDFPYPLFKREGYIILQNNKSCIILCLLSFNHEEL